MQVRTAATVAVFAAIFAGVTSCTAHDEHDKREPSGRPTRLAELSRLQEQLTLRPNDSDLVRQIGLAQWAIGDLDAAERFLRQSIANREDTRASEALLSVLSTRGHFVDAAALAARLAASGPATADWIRAIHQQFERTKGTQPASTALPLKRVDGALENSIGMRFVEIPGMSFLRGSETGQSDQQPVRRITLSPYLIGQYEVTTEQFRRFLADTRYLFTTSVPGFDDPGRGTYPAAAVSWLDAEAFAIWLSIREHAAYRLPTEAEWELAARGPNGSHEPWGNDKGTKQVDGNWGQTGFAALSATRRGHPPPVSPVGAFARDRSAFGVFDMAGNVKEWCLDEYHPTYYAWSPDRNPFGPMDRPGSRVLRGGSWNDPGQGDFALARWHAGQNQPYTGYGFRLVREHSTNDAVK